MSELDEYRKEIDDIDKQLTKLFEKRMDVVLKVGEYKKKNNLPVLNASREEQVLKKNVGYLENKGYEQGIRNFFNSLMNISKDLEHMHMSSESNFKDIIGENSFKPHNKENCRVGFYGQVGSFTEEAMINHFKNIKESKSYDEFEDVFIALQNDEIEYGVVPIENSSTGGISKVYDLLYKYNFFIVSEECVKIEEHLMGVDGAKIEDIKEVYSHEQPFMQSTEYLKEHSTWKLIPYYSTSISAKHISELNDKTKAAIASRRCSEIYNLNILKEQINNISENTTRFIIISKHFESDIFCNKLSVVFSMEHKAGALYQLVKHLADNKINMIKIESRPMRNEVWKYFLYVDFEGNIENNGVISALNLIKQKSSYFKLLGGYKNQV